MGLDIYAGTLTRYYSRNWKTVVQQMSEKYGMGFKVIRQNADGQDENVASPEEILRGVTQWKQAVENGLKTEMPYRWNEDNDETPYYTDKPDWDAYNALRVFFALKSQGMTPPEKVNKEFNPDDIEGFKEIMENLAGQSPILDVCEYYIPYTESYYFHYVTPTMREMDICTAGMLMGELDAANSSLWNADRETIMSWISKEGYPAEADIDENGVHNYRTVNEYNTESLAKFAFAILYKACEFAISNGVCIVLDY